MNEIATVDLHTDFAKAVLIVELIVVGNLTRALNGDLYFDDRVENWIKKV